MGEIERSLLLFSKNNMSIDQYKQKIYMEVSQFIPKCTICKRR
jgi:hypothetical protein